MRFGGWMLLGLIGLAVPQMGSTDEQPPLLFRTIEGDPRPPEDGRYRQSWRVMADVEAIRQPAKRLLLNLPDEAPEIVELEYWAPRAGYVDVFDPENPDVPITIPMPGAPDDAFSWRWYGKSARYTVAMTMVDGVISGRVTGAARRFALDPVAVGENRLGEVTPGYWRPHPPVQPRPGHGTVLAPVPAEASARSDAAGTADGATPASGNPEDVIDCSGDPPTEQYVIDVLVLYTTGVLEELNDSHANVVAKMNDVKDDANLALRNSGVNNVVYSLRGVEFVADPVLGGYDEMDIDVALSYFSGIYHHVGDPYYSFPAHCSAIPGWCHVESRRESQWADIVALARTRADNTCGYSYGNRRVTSGFYPNVPGAAFNRFAYFVFNPNCGADNFNFAHELGHQLGLEHDRRNFEQVDYAHAACIWAHGHKFSGGSDPRFRFRTVMADWRDLLNYGSGPLSCGSDEGCPQIPAYSTPLFEYDENATPSFLTPGTVPGARLIGVPYLPPPQPLQYQRADNADVLRRVARFAANYRDRPEEIFANGFQ